MPKIVCVKCKLQYKILHNGALVVEMFGDPPKPYKILESDAWFCPGCGSVVLTGMPENGVEHWMPDFDAYLQKELDSKRGKAGWVIYAYEKREDSPFKGVLSTDGYEVDEHDWMNNPYFRCVKCRSIVFPRDFAEHREQCGEIISLESNP